MISVKNILVLCIRLLLPLLDSITSMVVSPFILNDAILRKTEGKLLGVFNRLCRQIGGNGLGHFERH